MTQPPQKDSPNSVRKILLMGVFWRILFIEGVLLMGSLAWRWYSEDAGVADLLGYALRIIILVAIIIGFMMITLRSFLTQKIIVPLELLNAANKKAQKEFSNFSDVPLPPDTPDEIQNIAQSRAAMLKKIMAVSEERLALVNFIRETFGRYLSQQVVDQILSSPKGAQVGGAKKSVTVLMSDLRGFTSHSETRDPEEMVQLLNRYLERMSGVILKYGGIIDEIMGDAILAVFGAPESHNNDPERAIACAIEMQNSLDQLNRDIKDLGHPPLEMGIGINTGQVIVGNIGSDLRMKYGIVGDPVNRAARIESNSIGGQILIGEPTFEKTRSVIQTLAPGSIMMKGLSEPLVFYPVLSIHSPDFDLSLTKPARPATRYAISLPFTCWIIQDKKLTQPALSGKTLYLDEKHIFAHTRPMLPEFTDIKLKFDFCVEAHCFDDIYAKALETGHDDEKNLTCLAVTAMSDKDRAMLNKWMGQAAG